MRLWLAVVVGTITLSGALGEVAHAQTTSASGVTGSKGYVVGVAQSAFGNVTSQSYGGEFGVTVMKNVQVFAEFGQMRNVASSDLGTNALIIAGFLSQTQTGVSVSIKEPASFGAGGVRYLIPVTGVNVQPYVMGGFGIANVSKTVAFTVGGSDVTSSLSTQYGVVLGTDLSGDFTKPMITVGGGVVWPVWQQVVIDFQVRFGRIFPEDETTSAITASRAGVGFGVRF